MKIGDIVRSGPDSPAGLVIDIGEDGEVFVWWSPPPILLHEGTTLDEFLALSPADRHRMIERVDLPE